MSKTESTSSSGIGFAGLLTTVFITLKLIGEIDWPWLWVLSPIWISIVAVIVILVAVGAVLLVIALIEG